MPDAGGPSGGRTWRTRVRTMLAASSLALAAASVEDSASGFLGSVRARPFRHVGLTHNQQRLMPPSDGRELSAQQCALHTLGGPTDMRRWHDEAAHSRLVRVQQSGALSPCSRLRGGSDFGEAMKSKPAFLTKMQDGLASSRAAILWFIKGLLAAFTGLLTTSAVMVAFEFTAHKIRPVTDFAVMMPDYLAGLVLAGAVAGSVLGGWVLTKLSPSHPTVLALGVSSLFTAAQYMNMQVVAHPQWYKLLGLASFIPPYLLTSFFSSGSLSSAAPRGSGKSLRFASPKKSAAASSRIADDTPVAAKSSNAAGSRTPAMAKSKSVAEERVPKTPKSSSKASASTPGRTPGKKEAKTPKGSKTPKK